MSIKSDLKKKMNSGRKMDSEDLYRLVKDYENVSFDIFDTLVKRNVSEPMDIFSIMERVVGKGFRRKRIEAEKNARAELGKVEITIEDIYSFFPESERKNLIEQELSIELRTIVPNQPIAEVYKRCIEDGKTIYITSDMYWQEKSVREMLTKNGFTEYKELYLSSTYQKVKRDGSLFKHLLNREGISPEKLIHIGDSQRGDYKEPRKLGISAVKIPCYYKNIEFRGDEENDSIEMNYLNHFINNTFPCCEDSYYQFGYSQFGKLLYGYVHWIQEEAMKRGIKKLFFFARDGYIMKQAYEACMDNGIEVRYLEVSRRSLRGSILWIDCSYEAILKMVVNAKLVDIENVFDGIGLDIKRYADVIKRHGLDIDVVFDRSVIAEDKRLKGLIEEIQADIFENSKNEYELLLKYLEDNAVSGKFGVVDVGYNGSMQRYMQQVLTRAGIKHDITGFYLAVAEFYSKNVLSGVQLNLNGYLFDFMHDKNAIDTRSSFVGLFETLFLEQGGSIKRYRYEEGKVRAERYPYEYEVDGKPTEDLLKVRKIQQGAIDFVERASKDKLLKMLKCKPFEYFYGIHEIGTKPRLEDLRLFGDLPFYDEGVTEKLAAPRNIIYYVFHPKILKNDFLRCRWKTGFMKRLFKLVLPYEKLYQYLQHFK